jgi:quercetin dioxygenase-like cupin family protein
VKISKHLDTKPIEDPPGVFRREVITAADGAPNFCMRVFEVKPGSSTPYHTHPWEHETFILSGEGVVVSEKGETPIDKDSVVFIPPDEQHCFTNKGSDALRFICVIPIVD